MGLRPLACWDCGIESRRGAWKAVSCECCVLSVRGLGDPSRGVLPSVVETTTRRPRLTRTVEPWEKKVCSNKTKRSVLLKPCIYTLLNVSGHFVPSLKVIFMTATTSATGRFLAHLNRTVEQAILKRMIRGDEPNSVSAVDFIRHGVT